MKRTVWRYHRLLKLKNEVVNVTNQWAGLCFCSCVCNALVNLTPHYPLPGPTRAFDKGIDERPFSQGGAIDTGAFRMCVGLSEVCE